MRLNVKRDNDGCLFSDRRSGLHRAVLDHGDSCMLRLRAQDHELPHVPGHPYRADPGGVFQHSLSHDAELLAALLHRSDRHFPCCHARLDVFGPGALLRLHRGSDPTEYEGKARCCHHCLRLFGRLRII